MDKPDIRQVERRLVAVLKKKCREAIGHTVLTVLCTSAFVVLASLVALVLLGGVMSLLSRLKLVQLKEKKLELTAASASAST
jgi:hypothetical protein